mgnify:CR=1 FL=1
MQVKIIAGQIIHFIGSGVGAEVRQEDFRDDAVFQALVKNAPGDAGGTIGAGGYTNKGNYHEAQIKLDQHKKKNE